MLFPLLFREYSNKIIKCTIDNGSQLTYNTNVNDNQNQYR